MNSKLQAILSKGAVEAAPLLLGWIIARKLPEGIVKLKIVETEAYHQDDPASHSYRGMTKRNQPMFQAPGTIYVYFTYGMHFCMNIVCGPEGKGEAVLIRAAEPLAGIAIMQENRGVKDLHNIAGGPAKLTQALGIKDTALSGKKLNTLSIWLEPPDEKIDQNNIITSPRVGIREAITWPWRFYIKDNPFVSKV